MEIKIDNLERAEVKILIDEHLRGMKQHSPPESIHALGLEALKGSDITFYCAWENEELLGCGALKELDPAHGEIKSMRTAITHLRKGVAKQILSHLLEEAKRRGYQRISLETGSMAAFEPARKLYESFGFQYCPPFANYKEDPNSFFMTKLLETTF
ncbi:GNAT family N-acetyltransferase [Caldibacillus lycopersici]|uniref:GNAT family N-acetyltransferase n=1 Tax=Perspicuibacillus lycopersici TaxID=1325689 RepID=A0AAE3IX27_9BACI|nr:GNAT family N-acetyltransferase [Perspicuibacillus lycopersici]MCU9614974.1 GNAT family N-acetyltransferase [Perspicuibacillus lycopersici]